MKMIVTEIENEGLEALIGDSNRLIGTLAIMTLLKTGTEGSMDRLLKNISTFLYHIAEEYKIMVVQSLQRLCITFPTKYRIVIGFMSKFLREEGGFAFKQTIIESIVSLMNQIPETRETALLYLCEFIEDCEFVALSTEAIFLIGDFGSKTSCPSRYVRFIYNRCILENAMIRAAAVSALAKFAVRCPSLRKSILALLKSCASDENDETRDRVILSISILEKAELDNPFEETNGNEHSEEDGQEGDAVDQDAFAVFALATRLPMSFDNLARRLKAYQDIPGAMENSEPLVLSALPIVEELSTPPVIIGSSEVADSLKAQSNGTRSQLAGDVLAKHDPAAIIYTIPEFAAFGRVFRSCPPVALTEAESEYVVHCVKHIMDEHIILQFIVQNTIEDQRLENVSVAIHTDSEVFESAGELPAQSIVYGTTASCFTILEKQADVPFQPTAFSCELKFSVVPVGPETGEDEGEPFDEEYPLEDFEIFTADFVAKTVVADFRNAWEETGSKNEILQKFGLAEKTVANAASAVIDCMGMHTCDGTGMIKPGAKQHMLHLSGTFLGGIKILSRCQIACSQGGAIVLKIAIRSEGKDVSKLMAECIC